MFHQIFKAVAITLRLLFFCKKGSSIAGIIAEKISKVDLVLAKQI